MLQRACTPIRCNLRIAAASAIILFAPVAPTGVTLAAEAPVAAPKEVQGPEISMLIRSALIALHQANVTGNYSVLRDLGASVLQAANTPADLAAQFREFREKRFSLAATILFDPILDEKPQLSANGQLRLVGHFPTQPQEVIFDLTFLFEGGTWRLALISVGSRPAPKAEPENAAAKPKATAAPAGPATAPLPRSRPKP
jgi:hypothetical protein